MLDVCCSVCVAGFALQVFGFGGLSVYVWFVNCSLVCWGWLLPLFVVLGGCCLWLILLVFGLMLVGVAGIGFDWLLVN